MSNAKYCKDCKNMSCPENRVNCKYPDAVACDLYRDTPPTLFDRLTASPEVLAEKFVYAVHFGGLYFWHSTLIYPAFPFETKEKAIAATVAKLKEVCDE